MQVLEVLADNKELFKTLSLDDKKKIVDYVIFPIGMSPQEEKNNEYEVQINQQRIKEILGIKGIVVVGCDAVNTYCDLGCVIS